MSTLADRLRALPVLTATPPPCDLAPLPKDPAELFLAWLEEAIDRGQLEPHAMTVATVDAHGRPDARVLILKDISDDAWWFATSAVSAKGRQLAAHPHAALAFYWPLLGRQIRVSGPVVLTTEERNTADFLARGRTARALARMARESEDLSSRAELDAAVSEALRDDTVAPHWRRYGVRATSVEFWQADPDREHVRVSYRRVDGCWEQGLLWP